RGEGRKVRIPLMDNPVIRFFRFVLVDNWHITLAAVLGFVAVFLLLPRPRAAARPLGAALAALALLLAGVLIVPATGLSAETVLFYAFGGVALIAGGLLVTQSNPARAALSFALVVLSTCGLFLLLAAPFLMAATTIIYAGAIVVTFLFVIMLAQQQGYDDADLRSREPLLASFTGFVLLGAVLYVLHAGYGTGEIDRLIERTHDAASRSSVEEMAQALGDPKEPAVKGFFVDFEAAIMRKGDTPAARALRDDLIDNVRGPWVAARANGSPEQARKALLDLERIGLRARATYGTVQPPPGTPMSDLSGPSAATAEFAPVVGPAPPGGAIRRGADERPAMPHENTAYLGRALFTDYLLAVELGGTLLLVATIGAIAIAGRRGERNA
ncbi:MAG TPA: NADH-quinone oxidoreductase subunit J, partial [Gemmataceae bacterium]|nr:NADH-quinone oxidoreductase subunit J [Gemmataceae bacterium]